MENTDSPAEFIAPISRQMLRLVSIVIQRTAYIPLVRVYGRETVYVVELLSDIDAWGNYSTKPEKYPCMLQEIQWTNQDKGNLPDWPKVWKSFQGFVSSKGNCVVLCEDSYRTVTLEIPAD